MRVVSFLNMKGGVGKTSTCFHASFALARRGYRVLLVDADPQASLTQGCLGPTGAMSLDPGATIAALYRPGADPAPESLIVPSGYVGVWLLPGSMAAAVHNTPDPDRWHQQETALSDLLAATTGDYDLCLIDCPPNLYLASWGALLASTAVVVPVAPEDFGAQGLAPVAQSIASARTINPGLITAGYVLSLVDKRLAIHGAYEQMLRDAYGTAVFESPIPRAKDFVEAVAARKPVGQYKPRSAAAKAVDAFAAELLRRIQSEPEQGRGAA